MEKLLVDIEWHEQNEQWKHLLDRIDDAAIHTMNQGFEAEVARLDLDQKSFVLKTWNKDSRPNIQLQYQLLKLLINKGISVPSPVAWGANRSDEFQVLLTTYAGGHESKYDAKAFHDFGCLLASIHKIKVNEDERQQLANYGFIDYFYSDIDQYPDIRAALVHLVEIASIKQNRIIHGDYHWSNVVGEDGQYVVIDWTNGQMGDPRFDFAQSLVLNKLLFPSEWKTSVFRAAYLKENPIPEEEIEVFEAIVCLKWLIYTRSGFVPTGPKTLDRVKKMIKANSYLKEWEFAEVPKPKKKITSKTSSLDTIYKQFPLLQSKETVLKKIDETHVDDMCGIYYIDRICDKNQLLNWVSHFERGFYKKKCITWGVFSTENSDRLVGIMKAHMSVKAKEVMIEYNMNRSTDVSDIAADAIKTLLAYLFETVSMTKAFIEVAVHDEYAKKELLRNGFIAEDSIRQAAVRTGKGKEIVDVQVYCKLRDLPIN
ncbi:Ser/Thr protein kinase RdoA (MazF antagonist)/RimJ/RimL family protein N-acetyltransferase [Paenibacillus castaneae]|uniref:phosphotransferase family protein n=1 Tax=Paenibacillus castaneae TaxID=474957 RepID=UPI000C9CA86A|nr:phosphotransferase [Paenibacillus castaneae]NIK80240.1 Ser/Thr protein kinase RdoA (MazF antagonist)/RimJ/RimL family protein N-acetyltransferase [Paenibacillus castaneae]